MVVLRLLILISVPLVAAILVPPTSPSAWSRAPSNPVLQATEPWEGKCVCENVASYINNTWWMWYRGGWASTAVGLATSSDGITWTKYPGNPIYGLGGSGEKSGDDGGEPWVLQLDNGFLLYTTNNNAPARVNMLTSPDGIHWSPIAGSIALPPGATLWGNRVVWQEGGRYVMLHEAMKGGAWLIFLYRSTDALHWTIDNNANPLSSLQIHPGGMYGGPRILSVNGVLTPFYGGAYHVFYHAVNGTGNLPTNIYHAESKDLITWTVTPHAVLTHLGSGFEYDQVAGPVPLTVGGRAYIYYDGDNNNVGSCAIGLAMAAAVPA
eukprot:m.250773 g.250773  ORF g.250773 m.250773 type:complete len:322 (+) comp16891_c0_seq1:17-982(+)